MIWDISGDSLAFSYQGWNYIPSPLTKQGISG